MGLREVVAKCAQHRSKREDENSARFGRAPCEDDAHTFTVRDYGFKLEGVFGTLRKICYTNCVHAAENSTGSVPFPLQ